MVEVLAPHLDNNMHYDARLSANNNSLVLKITHHDISLLWPGDLEAIGEEMLLAQKPNLQAHILKAPHHGSRTSSTLDFVKQINPKLVIYSTGIANRFNFPHEEVRSRYEDHGAQSLNTAVNGEITIRITNNKLAVDAFVSGI